MARPKKEKESLRTRVILFRLTDEEFAKLSESAAEANMRINQLARAFTLAGQKRLIVETHAINDPALLIRLDRIGHNLNQLVKNAHIFGRVSPQIPRLCDQIEGIITEAVLRDHSP